jgi:hypothetical protein
MLQKEEGWSLSDKDGQEKGRVTFCPALIGAQL